MQAQIGGFVALSGNFGIRKLPGATAAQDELLIVSDTASASLTAGTAVRAGGSYPTGAVVIRGDPKIALPATRAAGVQFGKGVASASARGGGVGFHNTRAGYCELPGTVSWGGEGVTGRWG